MTLTYTILIILWLSLIVYAVLGGANFGGGIWDFFAIGQGAERQRRLIGQALGPVWETNLLAGCTTPFALTIGALALTLWTDHHRFFVDRGALIGPLGTGWFASNVTRRSFHWWPRRLQYRLSPGGCR